METFYPAVTLTSPCQRWEVRHHYLLSETVREATSLSNTTAQPFLLLPPPNTQERLLLQSDKFSSIFSTKSCKKLSCEKASACYDVTRGSAHFENNKVHLHQNFITLFKISGALLLFCTSVAAAHQHPQQWVGAGTG